MALQDQEQWKKQRVDSEFKRFILAVRKTVRESHQNGVNPCLTTGAAAQQTVTDWQALRRGWRRGHCATPSQLAHWDKFCFSEPVGTQWRALCHPCFWTPLRACGKGNQKKEILLLVSCISANFVFGRCFSSEVAPDSLIFNPQIHRIPLPKTESHIWLSKKHLAAPSNLQAAWNYGGSRKKAHGYLQRVVWNSEAYSPWKHKDEWHDRPQGRKV